MITHLNIGAGVAHSLPKVFKSNLINGLENTSELQCVAMSPLVWAVERAKTSPRAGRTFPGL